MTILWQLLHSIILLNAYVHRSTGNAVTKSINQIASPCTDFYEFSCSNINIDNALVDTKLKRLENDLNKELFRLLHENKSLHEPTAIQKAKEAFAACMNEGERLKRGNEQLKKTLEDYGGWPIVHSSPKAGTRKWELLAGKLRRLGYSLLVKVNVNVDQRNQNRHIVVLESVKPELPPQGPDELLSYLGILAAHSTFIRNVAALLGATSNEAMNTDIKNMLRFQMQLSRITGPPPQPPQYNLITLQDLEKLTSSKIDWMTYFNTIFEGIKTFRPNDEVVILSDIDYVKKLANLLAATDYRDLENYLMWRLVKDVAEDGDPEMVQLNNRFYGVEGGSSSKLETCIKEVKGFLGFAVSSLYLRNNDRSRHVEMAQQVVSLVKKAFEQLISQNSWMDPPTKTQAKNKLQKMTPKIGYPDWILDSQKLDSFYSKVNVNPTSHFSNVLHLSYIYSTDELQLINTQPVKSSWVVSPLISNAFYHRILNEIYIPVTILQQPFLDPDWPMTVSLGGIGSVIGHEITHGFDDESLLLAANNSLIPWWSAATTPRFHQAAECVEKQYDNYCPIGGEPNYQRSRTNQKLCINGKKTLHENVADIGGIKAAFLAHKIHTSQSNGNQIPSPLKHMSADQLLFISFAQIWCTKVPQREMIKQLMTSSNSPSKYRLIGSLENLDGFSEAFNCTNTNKKPTTEKCNIW